MKTISRATYRKLQRIDAQAKRLHARMDKLLESAIAATGEPGKMGYTSDWIFGAIDLEHAMQWLGLEVEPDKRQRSKDAIFRR